MLQGLANRVCACVFVCMCVFACVGIGFMLTAKACERCGV